MTDATLTEWLTFFGVTDTWTDSGKEFYWWVPSMAIWTSRRNIMNVSRRFEESGRTADVRELLISECAV